jgi:hypothetical protein
LTGLFARQFGTPNYAAHGGFCSVNMAAGMIYTIGGSFWEFGGPDLARAKLFVMIGTAEDHHSNPLKIAISKFKRSGGRFVSINPVHPRIVQKAPRRHGRLVQYTRVFSWAQRACAARGEMDVPTRGVRCARRARVPRRRHGQCRHARYAFPVQFAGLVAERWYFFAQARHPQNLYYQFIS